MKYLFLSLMFIFMLSSCEDSPTDGTEKERTCVTVDDCKEGEFCINNICKKDDNQQQTCDNTSQCPEGYYCTANGICEIRTCTVNSDCPDGQKCENQRCVEKGCTIDSDCEVGFKCSNNECIPRGNEDCRISGCSEQNYTCNQSTGVCEPNEYCSSDSECAEGFKCNLQTGICEETAPECIVDSDCSNGEKCIENECIVNAGCSSDADCDFNKPACNTLTGICYECLTNSHCPNGKTCDTTLRICEGGTSDCTADSDCGLNRKCDTSVNPHVCIDNAGGCSTNADCSNGLVCYTQGRRCVQCVSNTNCTSPLTCNPNTFLCENAGTGDCTTNTDCATNETCVNGRCQVSGTGGTCDTSLGLSLCLLMDGYCDGADGMSGNCVFPSDPCENVTCPANSSCEPDENDEAACYCNTGYVPNAAGNACVVETTNPCLNQTCSSHGTCVNTNGTASCNCNTGYHAVGLTCVIDDVNNPCNGVTCSGHGTCVNTNGTASCTCNSGYVVSGLNCNDINECTANTDNCDVHATCTNTAGSFTCICNAGYVGNGVTCNVSTSAIGDNCSSSMTTISASGNYTGDTSAVGYTNDFTSYTCAEGSIYNPGSKDMVFKLSLSTDAFVYAEITEAEFSDSDLALTSTCGTTALICDDDSGESLLSKLSDFLSAGTYYLIVDGYGTTNQGEFNLWVGIYNKCTTDSQCTSAQVCESLTATAKYCIPKCSTNSDCASDYCITSTGHCGLNYTTCNADPVSNSGCATGKTCWDDGDGMGTYCYPNQGGTTGDICEYADECSAGYLCVGTVSAGYECTEACRTNSDCSAGDCTLFSGENYGYCN